jgi:glycosyltransferase involved in cell wall biosynthesis
VLVVAPEPFYEDRGTPIAVRWMLEALTQCGHTVDLLTYPVGETIELPGLRTYRIPNLFRIRSVPIGFSIRKLMLDVLLVPALWRRLRQERYDYIHALEESAFPAVLAGRWRDTPVVYDMQSRMPEVMKDRFIFRSKWIQSGLLFFERWLIRHADLIVCSMGVEEYVRRVDPGARMKVWFFPGEQRQVSAAELTRLRQDLGISAHARIVLYTGNFEGYQGLSRLLAAVPRVLAVVPDTVFVLVGGKAPSDMNSRFGLAGDEIRGALRIVPRQPKGIIARFLALADLVVSPREPRGTLPLKIFDYMAAAKPIVAVDSPHHRRVLDDERALLVEASPEALAEGITWLLLHGEEAEQMGIRARAYADKELRWEAFLKLVSGIASAGRSLRREDRGSE